VGLIEYPARSVVSITTPLSAHTFLYSTLFCELVAVTEHMKHVSSPHHTKELAINSYSKLCVIWYLYFRALLYSHRSLRVGCLDNFVTWDLLVIVLLIMRSSFLHECYWNICFLHKLTGLIVLKSTLHFFLWRSSP